jgi:mannose-6-phosphate isomerase-like protein (cupin superfamily)
MESFYSIFEIRQQIPSRRPYIEFLRVPAMSCGVYVLQAGEEDPQVPHNEDEIYYVVSGVARMRVVPANQPEQDRVVTSGDVIFVKAMRSIGSTASPRNWCCWWSSPPR